MIGKLLFRAVVSLCGFFGVLVYLLVACNIVVCYDTPYDDAGIGMFLFGAPCEVMEHVNQH